MIELMIYRGVKMKDDAEKKKDQRDALKAVGIAIATILLIISLILAIQQLGIG